MTRQQFQFQTLLLLASILASSAFTISSGRMQTSSARIATKYNHWQPQHHQRCSGTESLQTKSRLLVPSVDTNSNPLHYHSRSCSHSSSSTSLASRSDDNDDVSVAPKWKRFLMSYKYNMDGSLKEDDGETFKQKLAKMGLSALLSYGFVSNLSYCVTVSLAWFGFSKKTGLSPLAPNQWKGFLAVYSGFYVFNSFIRPMRLAVSVGVTPYFDRAVAAIQKKMKLSKGVSIGIVVFLANVCGTTSLMSLGIYIASLAAGVPIFVPKA